MVIREQPTRKPYAGGAAIIYSTKIVREDGWHCDYAIVYNENDIILGTQEGDKLSSEWLKPGYQGYKQRFENYLARMEESDYRFYRLIAEEIEMAINREINIIEGRPKERDMVIMTDNRCAHGFAMGEEVVIMKANLTNKGHINYTGRNEKGNVWHFTDRECRFKAALNNREAATLLSKDY